MENNIRPTKVGPGSSFDNRNCLIKQNINDYRMCLFTFYQIMLFIKATAFSSARAFRKSFWYLSNSSSVVCKQLQRSTMCRSDRTLVGLSSIGFGRESPRRFAVPSFNWGWQPASYIIYRCLIALYQLVWLVLVLKEWGTEPHYRIADTKWKWFIYISNWSYLLLTMYFIIAAIAVIIYHKYRSKEVDNNMKLVEGGMQSDHNTTPAQTLPFYFSLTWLLQVVAFSAAVTVTLLFWVLVYDPAVDTVHTYVVHVHGVNTLLVLIDVFAVANPYRLIHFIYPSIYASIYFIFTAIYWAAGGLNEHGDSYIYKGNLDWENDPRRSVITALLAVCLGAPAVHILLCLLFRIKNLVFIRCCTSGQFI
ncbi:protein rolling stone-like [Anneissia japonica]|uniref:protein rolling stone-like n=1 Tax=Anneissia japonica TaxID=1529436 RepID=UPI0014259DED|nr:protein rolling stone-like [Anneissia japonica]